MRPLDLLRLWRGKTIKRIPVKVPRAKPVHRLTLTAIVRNEADCLDEWIDFHAAQGVEHFHIYDNESTDGTAAVLERHVKSGLVTVVPWVHRKGYHTQARAYAHALTTFGPSCRWMGFIDVDEFLYCPAGETLPDFLSTCADWPALLVHRHTFGTSGYLKPPGSVVEHFYWRMPAPRGPFYMQGYLAPKSIVQPRHVAAVNGAHRFVLRGGGGSGRDERGEVLVDRNAPAFRDSRIRINHYYTKDRQTFLRRISRRRTASNILVPDARWMELLHEVDSASTIFDDSILHVLPREVSTSSIRQAS